MWKKLPDEEFDDDLIGEYSGAGAIFGVTGGVMEAAIRTAYHILTNQELEPIEFSPCRGLEGIKEATLKINGQEYNFAMCSGMKNAKVLLEQIKNNECKYPLFLPNEEDNIQDTYIAKRAKVLYDIDKSKKVRRSHLNPDIITLYKDYLGEYGSPKAHKLLHTHYNPNREKYPDLEEDR